MSPIELDCIQGSAEWYEAKNGCVSASQLHRILTPTRYDLSKQRYGYMDQLVAENLLGYSEASFLGNDWTERGHHYEQEARDAISLMLDTEPPRSVGFVYRDESRTIGCSPDALIGDDGGAEIKCPSGAVHCGYLRVGGVPSSYWLQVQGSMWITGRTWWVFESYHPDIPRPHIVRVTPDRQVFEALDEHIPQFISEMLEARERIRESMT